MIHGELTCYVRKGAAKHGRKDDSTVDLFANGFIDREFTEISLHLSQAPRCAYYEKCTIHYIVIDLDIDGPFLLVMFSCR